MTDSFIYLYVPSLLQQWLPESYKSLENNPANGISLLTVRAITVNYLWT